MASLSSLWVNHPGPGSSPCKFANQCAIRMGVALDKSGIDLTSFTGVRCWHHKPKHILRAQQLADWLTANPQHFGPKKVYKDVTSKDFKDVRGIVFIKDGWGATDHIDIWNGSSMKTGEVEWFELGSEVWFWKER